MSPAQNKYPQPPQPPRPPSSEAQADAQASSSPKPPSSADTIMDQHPESTLIAIPPTPPKVMSSSAPDQDSLPASPASVSSESPPTSVPAASQGGDSVAEPVISLRQQPIPPASEPMQYRAIGLVRGRYMPSEEQFTRGILQSDDGVPIDAVLLGRVMSLVKKHLDLEQPHLWVVYPRTREKAEDLHVQIVGVWEPEKLNRADSLLDQTDDTQDAEDAELDGETEVEADLEVETPAPEVEPEPRPAESKPEVYMSAAELDDRYFSVRGEVVYQAVESEQLLVKIRRSPRQGSDQSKAFKVALKGVLEGKAVGYFWDFQVRRQENLLVVQEATMIGMVPPTKRGKGAGGRPQRGGRRGPGAPRPGSPGGARKRWNAREGGPPQRGERPSIRPQREQREQREPIAKPIIKRRPKDSSAES